MEAARLAAVPTGSAIDPQLEALDPTAETGPLVVTLGGQTFTCRGNRPLGAFVVFAARAKAGDPVTQASAPLRLLQAWIIPEDHDRLFDVVSEVEDLEVWMSGEFGEVVGLMVDRPTSAP